MTEPGATPDSRGAARHTLTLAAYVRRRNGVPLGASGSLPNMLRRSLGAGSFAGFWRFWNPIWGYYLGRYVNAPLARVLPAPAALVATFAVSGALHDLAISIAKLGVFCFFTPWFVLLGSLVVITEALRIRWGSAPWMLRALANLVCVAGPALALAQAGFPLR